MQGLLELRIRGDGASAMFRPDIHLNYAQIHFASVAAFVAGWRSS